MTNIIYDSKNSNRKISSLVVLLLVMFFLTFYNIIKYYRLSQVFIKGMNTEKTSLIVSYDNLRNFEIYSLNATSDYRKSDPV